MFFIFREQIKEILTPYSEGAEFDLSYPKREFGHYSTNIAFGLAKKNNENAMKTAGVLVSLLNKDKKAKKLFSDISVAPPGFINFKLSDSVLLELLKKIAYNPGAFAKNDSGKGKKVNLEFISANPTGPLTLGNGRSAAYGNALSNILEFSGHDVTKEYFINDVGVQIEKLGESVARRFMQINGIDVDFPEGLYPGGYITEIAEKIKKNGAYHGPVDSLESLTEFSKEYAVGEILERIKKTVEKFGVKFDVWFSEKSLQKEIDSVFDELNSKNLIYDAQDAVWFKASEFGLEKDVVLRKSIGDKPTTYLASDFAYAKNKISRGFDLNVYILGADHHGDVPRIKAGISALGFERSKFVFLIHQLVGLKEGGERKRMGKRKGNFVLLEDLAEELPPDVIKFFFLEKSLNRHMDFDIELAKEESNKNPVYYAQYAHARICALERKAKEQGYKADKKISLKKLENLKDKEAVDLVVLMARFPEIVEDIAENYQIHDLTTYLRELASAINFYYDKYRVLDDKAEDLIEPRLVLLSSAREILKLGLSLLGITAPERM